MGTSSKETVRADRSIAFCVVDSHTCPRCPLALEAREGDAPGLGLDVLADDDGGGYLVEPVLGLVPSAEMPSALAALVISVECRGSDRRLDLRCWP